MLIATPSVVVAADWHWSRMAIVQRHWEARCCCFYGWWILALLVLSMCAAHSGSMLLNSLTIAEMMDEFAGEVRSTLKARYVAQSADHLPYVMHRELATASSV
eukprot:COSAG02_NODE_4028_length_5886_cov_2.738552_4_plen_103_part_00